MTLFNTNPQSMQSLMPVDASKRIAPSKLSRLNHLMLDGVVGKYVRKDGEQFIKDNELSLKHHQNMRQQLFESLQQAEPVAHDAEFRPGKPADEPETFIDTHFLIQLATALKNAIVAIALIIGSLFRTLSQSVDTGFGFFQHAPLRALTTVSPPLKQHA